LKVADYVIQSLGDYGIKDIFVVYGGANGDLIDAFTRVKNTRYICTMHEQAGSFAAECYAKVTGKPAVAIATSGPGGHNFVTGIANCYYDSTPCLFITGQIHSKFLRPDPSIRQVGFQETDIVSIVKPITKYAKMVTAPLDIKYELEKALHIAQSGRPGPVLLDLPVDVQKAEVEVDTLVGYEPVSSAYDMVKVGQQINQFFDDLYGCKRPVILVGGGVRTANAVDSIKRFATLLSIPCFPTWNALDIITSDLKYYGGRVGTYGGPGRNFAIQNCDLLLAIGSRISGRITGGNLKSFARAAKKYVVDVDETLLDRKLQQVPFDVNIHCDAKAFLSMILKRYSPYPVFSDWVKQVMVWRDKYDPVLPELEEQKEFVHPYVFMKILSEELEHKDIIVADCGGNLVVASQAFETKMGQRFITSNGNSPMGFSFAGAMGAWFAAPDRNVVCLIGDGGFNMNIQELQTYKNYGVKVKTFIMNNHIYGITKAFQETNFQGRAEACGPKGYSPPDFVKVAQAYGIRTVTMSNNAEIREKIREVMAYDEAVVCDVNMHEYHTYDPRIFGWNTPIEDMFPYLSREEFRKNMIIEPVGDWEHPVYPDIH